MKALHIGYLLLASRILGGSSESPGITPTQAGPISSDSAATTDGASQESDDSSPEPTIQTDPKSSGVATSDGSPESDLPPYYEAPSQSGSTGPSGAPTPYQPVPAKDSSSALRHGGDESSESLKGKEYRSILYFTSWSIYHGYQPQDIPVDEITHLLYSFADIKPNGTVVSSDPSADIGTANGTGNNANGCVGHIFRLKQEHRNLKVLLSIGGYNWSHKFVSVAATPGGRHNFARSAVRLMANWGFDGLDIDWEYPADKSQAADFVELLKECRKELDEYADNNTLDYHFEITVAVSAGAQNYETMDLEGMDPLLDGWHLMAYDYALSGDPTSGHQAALFADKMNPDATKANTNDAVAGYLDRGITARKIALGIPLYGRSFMAPQGVGKSPSSVGKGPLEGGVYLYKDLPPPGAEEDWDERIGAAWSLDSRTGEFVSYDTVKSTKYKVEWLVKKDLGGAMFWEAQGDKTGEGSLVETVAKAFPRLDETPNWLDYPDSVYKNIRNGNGGGSGRHSSPSTGFTAHASSTFPSNSPALPHSTPLSKSTAT